MLLECSDAMDIRLIQLHHDSPAGHWDFAGFEPGPPWDDYLQMVWAVEGQASWSREKILPSSHIEVLINLGQVHHLLDRRDPSLVTEFHHAWVSGLQQRYLLIESLHGTRMMGIRLPPLGAYRFFGIPMQEISDQVIDLDLVLGARAIGELRCRLLEAAGMAERVRMLARWTMRRLSAGPEQDATAQYAYQTLLASGGEARIGDLSQELGISQRHLIERFRRQVGLSPKRFARIVRYRRAIDQAQRMETVDWAALALECGYYDQAHFIHDFRSFTGSTPTEFMRLRVPSDDETVSMVVE